MRKAPEATATIANKSKGILWTMGKRRMDSKGRKVSAQRMATIDPVECDITRNVLASIAKGQRNGVSLENGTSRNVMTAKAISKPNTFLCVVRPFIAIGSEGE